MVISYYLAMRSCAARVRFGWVIGFVKKDICVNRWHHKIINFYTN
jgi:hypothetical protein